MLAASAANAMETEDGSQFTMLGEITPKNVGDLRLAFSYRTGDLNQGFTRKQHSFQTTPVFWQGSLYISTSSNQAIAINAKTGDEIWRYDAGLDPDIGYSESASRGVAIWHGESDLCAHRVFLGTLSGEIHAINASTGQLCRDFAVNGVLDLKSDITNLREGDYGVTSPGAVMKDRIIIGSAIGDNGAVELEQGIVRAVNPITGRLIWSWDPIPRTESDPAYKTWEDRSAMITGAANAWAPISVDPQRKLVFVPTSSPSPDFYGGEREGKNLYSNSIVALNSEDGTVVWHRQLVHHDLWDYDIPAEPSLIMLNRDGVQIPAVVVVTKMGMLYAFNRETGETIFDIEERPVPQSDVQGEVSHPTQPFSSIVLADQRALGPDDAFGLAVFDKWGCQRILESFRSEGIYTPPSTRGTVQNPGWGGGMNWGGVSLDVIRQIALVNYMQLPGLIKLLPRAEYNRVRTNQSMKGWQLTSMSGTPYGMARRLFLSELGLPCIKPPWGKIAAVDLTNGKILWDRPFGTIEDLAPAIVPNFRFGVPNIGGPLSTATDLTFIGATADHYFRAIRTSTGEELWRYRLPTTANAGPMSYSIEGSQHIAIAIGGYDGLDRPRGDYLMVFRL